MTGSQPEALTAFLMSAEYHIRQSEIPEDAGESLRAAAGFYALRLHAAVQKALAFHVHSVIEDMLDPFHYCETCSGHPAWPCPEVQAITGELLREGETDG